MDMIVTIADGRPAPTAMRMSASSITSSAGFDSL
jgi:hypothetical protein